MKPLMKKRTKAFMIDLAISTAVTGVAEYFLRKKIKNEAFHALVTPVVVMYALESVQIRRSGQTIGYKKMGLTLEDEKAGVLTSEQLMKRMIYRDTWSTVKYLGTREEFVGGQGSILPHDHFAGTIVKEV